METTAAALDAFAPTLRATAWSALRSFDLDHRSRTFDPARSVAGWWHVNVIDVERIVDATSDPAAATALLCMHPDGHVRERAVRFLAESEDELALPVLLVRTADWVRPVQAAAVHGVEARRVPDALPSFRRAAGLLARLMEASPRSASYATEVHRWIGLASDAEDVRELLASGDRALRRSVACLLVERGEALDALPTASAGDDPAVVGILLSALSDDELSGDDLERLWRSHHPACRARALHRWQHADDQRAADASEVGLIDRAATVRFLAQRHLAKEGVDAAGRYRSMLTSRPADGARGLCEVGTRADAALLHPLLDADAPRVRREAVRAIGRLEGVDAEARVRSLLVDPSPSVARAAAAVLIGIGPSRAGVEAAFDACRAPAAEGARRAALRLLRAAGRWEQVRISCLAIADADPVVREVGSALLDHCLRTWNRSFTDPPRADVDHLRAAVAAAVPSLPALTADLLRLSVAPHLGT